MSLALTFHILAAVIWIGGMFFAHVVLRPSAGALDLPTRLALWDRVLGRFFMWVWLSIVALLLSGFAMVFITHDLSLLHAIGRSGSLCDSRLAQREEAEAVAAGWPVLGQFIAHDITADRSPA